MVDHLSALRTDSARFGELLGRDLSAPVPSCPGWSMLDLANHLTDVQAFWAVIAGRLLMSPDGVDTETHGIATGLAPFGTSRIHHGINVGQSPTIRHPPRVIVPYAGRATVPMAHPPTL